MFTVLYCVTVIINYIFNVVVCWMQQIYKCQIKRKFQSDFLQGQHLRGSCTLRYKYT